MSRSTYTWDDEPSRTNTSVASASGVASGSKSKIPIPTAVRDDWEMDDDEEEDPGQPVDVRNKQIWEDADSKVYHPMPSLVISRGTSSTSATPSLPLNQPPAMRILKRPSPSLSPSQSSTNINTGETLQEREARYQTARERIFGSPGEEAPDSRENKKKLRVKKSSPPNSSASPSSKVSREPHGPNTNGDMKQVNKGFGDRKTKPPPPATTPSTTTPISSPNIHM